MRQPEAKPATQEPVRQSNSRSGSTHSEWEWRKMRRRPQGQQVSGPKGRRWYRHPRWDRRRKLTVTIKWRGGPEAWVEVHARGSFGRFPGHTALVDVVDEIMRP